MESDFNLNNEIIRIKDHVETIPEGNRIRILYEEYLKFLESLSDR